MGYWSFPTLKTTSKSEYLRFSCPTCGALRKELCSRLSWPHYTTRPHAARLRKVSKKK